MAFDYEIEELPGYTSGLSLQGGFRATRRFRVPFSHHVAFMAEMIGQQFPTYSAVRCIECSVEPQTDLISGTVTNPTSDIATFDDCIVTCNYESVQASDNSDGTFFTYRQSLGAEFLTIPSRALKWSDNNKPVNPDAHGAILVPKTEHHITWHRVSSPNWSVLSSLRGKVNSGAMSIPVIGLSCPAETLLFEGAETSIQVDSSGNGMWEVSVRLSEKKVNGFGGAAYGWNHVYRDNPAGWAKPKDGAGNFTYASADLSAAFTQA